MKVKKTINVFLIFFLLVGLNILAVNKKPEEKAINSKEKQSLVRKELLTIKRKEPSSPRRNIFSPGLSRIKNSQLGMETSLNSQSLKTSQASGSIEASSSLLDVRYIGYIDSGENIVALIIFEGQALAVQEGEKLSEEMVVGKVTTKQIEIIGPGLRRQKYSLQGEEE